MLAHTAFIAADTNNTLSTNKNPPVSLVAAIDPIAQGGAVIQVPNLGQNLQNGNKIDSEHSVHSV